MTRAWMGGLAALLLLSAAPAAAQTHSKPTKSAATAGASAPPVSSTAPAAPPTAPVSRAEAAKARYADCMSRYKDRKGCRYLAWHRRS